MINPVPYLAAAGPRGVALHHNPQEARRYHHVRVKAPGRTTKHWATITFAPGILARVNFRSASRHPGQGKGTVRVILFDADMYGAGEARAWAIAHGYKVRSVRKATRKRRKNRQHSKRRRNPWMVSVGNPPAQAPIRISLAEARARVGGAQFEEAVQAYKAFHGCEPDKVDLYLFDDGRPGTQHQIRVALGVVPETHYQVPWSSNKQGYHWQHEHPVGKEPLEVYDPATQLTSKIPGPETRIRDWWYG